MAAINDLINQIEDEELKSRIENELDKLGKQKKYGLVYEDHLPECTPLYDVKIRKGSKVALKDKEITNYYEVLQVLDDKVLCISKKDKEIIELSKKDVIVIAEFGEPIYPYLQLIDSVSNNPDSDLWHTLIQADNYHALQFLNYLYPQKIDCIYIDPPYNTGAHDWKYNNDYVDSSDVYRHSKWLSMIEKRIRLAQSLLNPKKSVLIVTIDEKEYLHLGCLLEQLFPDAKIQMITSVISAKGVVRAGQFSRVEEYIYFVQIGDFSICQTEYNMLDEGIKKEAERDIEWLGFRRRAPQAIRTARPNQFYPIYVNKDTGFIESIGEVVPQGVDRHTVPVPENCVALWPLSKDGDERMWSLTPGPAKSNFEKGYLRVNNWNKETQTGTVYYLPSGTIDDLESGVAIVTGRNEDNSVIAHYGASGTTPPKKVWNQKLHNAETYGTNLLQDIIGGGFSYPKSLYAVLDTLRFCVGENKNALVIDFFAGSGTTLHAINMLNAEDNGNRRCIIVTNNEVSEDEEKELRKRGFLPNDKEWDELGIAKKITWPRTKCSINGIDRTGKPLKGEYFTQTYVIKENKRTVKQISIEICDGKDRKKLIKQIVSMIDKSHIKQSLIDDSTKYIFSEDSIIGMLFDISELETFIDGIKNETEILYIFTTSNKEFNSIKASIEDLPPLRITEIEKTPMSEGFKANAAFFKLSFLDKTSIELGRQFKEMLPTLWLKAGSKGPCPSIDSTSEIPSMLIYPENKMAILTDENYFSEFELEMKKYPDIQTVYLITDFEKGFKSMKKALNRENTYQLYRDYLDNFRINTERK